MGFLQIFKRSIKKSTLRASDFSYSEERVITKSGDEIIFEDYNGKAIIWNNEIDIYFSKEGISNVDEFLKKVNERIDLMNASRKEIEKNISLELLSLRNDTWKQSEDDIITEKEFLGKIKPDHLTITSDLSYELRFLDGDVFWGHTILYSGDNLNNFKGVTLEG
jgi:hypothetical protein